MFRIIIYALIVALTLTADCQNNPNKKQLIQEKPLLLKSNSNGQKLLIGDLADPEGNYLYIANVKGTSYEMGKALGQLFGEQIKGNLKIFYDYYLGQLEQILINASVPTFIAKGLTGGVHKLANRILDLNVMITRKYTNPRYYEQIAGIAAGAKIRKKDISRLNIFPELIKAACTVAGVWGKAAANGETLHVRSLDWDAGNPISKYPMIIVYHPTAEGTQAHANIGWAGFVGALTGFSPKISIGEKVWYPPSGSVQMTRYGNPWTYVLRDVLYEATNIISALRILSTTHRTCAIHLGLGSSEDHSFRMLEYSKNVLINYNDKNYTHYDPVKHPQREGIAYFDKHVQPSNNDCVGHLLTNASFYGKWETENLWRILGQSHQTGDTQLVVFNLQRQIALISYSRVYQSEGKLKTENAYNRSPMFVDFNDLWKPF